jgi:hypothetical protein
MRRRTRLSGAKSAAHSASRATGRTPDGEHNFYFELSLCRKAFSLETGHQTWVIEYVGRVWLHYRSLSQHGDHASTHRRIMRYGSAHKLSENAEGYGRTRSAKLRRAFATIVRMRILRAIVSDASKAWSRWSLWGRESLGPFTFFHDVARECPSNWTRGGRPIRRFKPRL